MSGVDGETRDALRDEWVCSQSGPGVVLRGGERYAVTAGQMTETRADEAA